MIVVAIPDLWGLPAMKCVGGAGRGIRTPVGFAAAGFSCIQEARQAPNGPVLFTAAETREGGPFRDRPSGLRMIAC